MISDRDRKKFVDPTSSSKIYKADNKMEVLEDDREVPGTSRDNNMSKEARKGTNVLNNDEKTVPTSKIKSYYKNRTITTWVNTFRAKNDEDITTVAGPSTSSFGKVVTIRDNIKTTSSEQQDPEVNIVKPTHPYPRNFSLEEQYEMLKYLIKNHRIMEARGYTVWKDMIKDGYLKHRTMYSLNNHFRKHILPNIDSFTIEAKTKKKFKSFVNRRRH